VLLVTCDALRADVVEPGLMPHLARFLAGAEWSGTAVAPSSWTVPSMASLFTGLQPWRHGARHAGGARLSDDLVTLPEALAAEGLATAGFRSNHWLEAKFGYDQGFDVFRRNGGDGRRAGRFLAAIDGSPRFVWVHILPPHAPYRRHEAYLDRLGDPPADLPKRIAPLELERWFDPAVPLPAERRRRMEALYRLNAAWADEVFGVLLAGLERSGRRAETLVVVTSDHGEEFGEHGQTGHGGNLGRELVEVPLGIDLPAGFTAPLALPRGARPGIVRLYATLLEAVGGEAPEAAAPSLFAAGELPILSELYLGNGSNELSLVEGSWQLRWRSWFATPEADYYRARLLVLGGRPEPPPEEPARVVFDRLEAAFAAARPLTGTAAPPDLLLSRWPERGGDEPVDAPGRREAMARDLKALWLARNGADVPPGAVARPQIDAEDLERLRALGYIP
jgi:arylsulfatase